ncbi:MAG: MFS transporter [Bryobacteraceae bacterium]
MLTFGVFFKSLSQDFHAGRAAISLAFTLHSLTAAVCAPLAGRLIDRFGARKIIVRGTAIFGLTLLSAKVLGVGIGYLYLFYMAVGIASGGATPVPYGVVVSHWFNRRRGLALGLMMLGLGVGAIAFPLVAHRVIGVFGWRAAYAAFGCAVLLVSLPVLAAFLKDDPKEKGLLQDGALPSQAAAQQRARHEGLTWHETWHSSTFWLMISAFFLSGASVQACVLHMPALLSDRGASAQDAAIGSSLVGLALVIGRVGAGYLLDRFFAPRLTTLLFGATSIGIALLWLGSAGKIALFAALLVGMGMGAEVDIIAYCMSRYFGLKAFGTTYGYVFGAFILAGAVGPLLMGAGFDLTHSYTVPLGVFFFAMLSAAGLMTRLGPYRYLHTNGKRIPRLQLFRRKATPDAQRFGYLRRLRCATRRTRGGS